MVTINHQESRNSYTDKIYIRKIGINRGGYTSDGIYFGVGSPVYFVQSYDGHFENYVRASHREDVVFNIRKLYPNAKIRG